MNEPAPPTHPSPIVHPLLSIAALCIALPGIVAAQAPVYRVADINAHPVLRSSSPRQFHTLGDQTVFVAEGDAGTALWRTDGSADGTRAIVSMRGSVHHAAVVDGALLLMLDLAGTRTLWRSDGTAGGTLHVASFPTPIHWITPTQYAAHDGALFFVAGDTTTGYELWRSDGTVDGTERVIELRPGPESPFLDFLGTAGGLLLFSGDDRRLWRSNGSAEGTVPVGDVHVWSEVPAVELGGVVYFTADARRGGSATPELWRSDGTSAGTGPVSPGLTTHGLIAVGDRLFFLAHDESHGTELWQSDGTAAGTAPVADLTPGPASSGMDLLADLDGTLMFRLHRRGGGYALWRSDGTADGTVAVAALPTATACTGAAAANGALWLIIDDVLWRSDGTAAGTAPLAPAVASRDHLQNCRWPLFAGTLGGVVFAAGDSNGIELWISDGTVAGTGLLRNLADDRRTASAVPHWLTAVGAALYFAADDGLHGRELWISDGSTAGTRLVADLRPGAEPALGWPGHFTSAGDRLYFVADDGDGPALWISDGTAAGTVRLTDAAAAVSPDAPTEVNGTWFFVAGNAAGGSDLWRSDGTAAGTRRVRTLMADARNAVIGNLTELAGGLYFSVGATLWHSDGRDEGTGPVRDLPATITQIEADAGTLYLAVSTWGSELWTSDGTAAGTELWTSDGTAAGTERIASIPEAYGLGQFTTLQNVMFFVTDRFVWGGRAVSDALWRTDGTAAGTRRLSPLLDGAFGDSPYRLTPIDDVLFYFAVSYGQGVGLYRSDVDGNVAPLAPFWRARSLTAVGDRLLFLSQPRNGRWGAWESDGSGAGTRQLAAGLGEPYGEIAIAGETAYFTLADDAADHELWALPLDALGRCGNGAIDAGEACDAGGAAPDCEPDCTLPVCGDGRVNPGAGETCDDGNRNDDDCCSNTCGSAAPGRSCTDGDRCNGAEVCDAAGTCVAGTPQDCGDRCTGDCDGDSTVDIAELLAMVRALLHGAALPCALGATTGDGVLTVDQVVAALGHALDGCPGPAE
jgi:ELWxxDGT repeat protein